MRIAVPAANGLLAQHFGHCDKFALFDADPVAKRILGSSEVDAPEHQPGLLPPWLKERGVDLVIAGGMGGRARALFQQAGVEVVTGAPSMAPDAIVRQYLDGTLVTGENACDH